MIKFIGIRGNRTLLGMGLSEKNIKELQKKPIFFNGEDVGLSNQDFFIMYGETEETITKELKPLMAKNMNIIKTSKQ